VTPLEDAQAFVWRHCPPLPVIATGCTNAAGYVLAADVVADEPVPPFANTAVDGYAVIAADLAAATNVAPVELPVVDEVAAGAHTERVLQPGEAIRIMTGAPIPAGADAVVMVEHTERLDGGARVAIRAGVEAGAAIRPAGSDVQPGELVFTAGTVVTPAVVGVLASVNALTVQVHRRARVAVLSTGDELVTDGGPLGPGQIRESNLSMLVAALADAGCNVDDFGVVPDDEARLEAVLRQAASECDAIVTSGGVSMGDYDVVKAVLGRIAEMHWMQIAIKPAKPFAFGMLRVDDARATPVFGLPGNPVSSLVSFELLARPALRQMMGHERIGRPRVLAVADEGITRRVDGKLHLDRVIAEWGSDGRCHVHSARAQGSHQLAATATANAIAEVPDGPGVAPGGDVLVHLLT
jgi:molybdopterin molybdotransferase